MIANSGLYFLAGIIGIILTAATFHWIFGMSKLKRNSDRTYLIIKEIARLQGVNEDSIRQIDAHPKQGIELKKSLEIKAENKSFN